MHPKRDGKFDIRAPAGTGDEDQVIFEFCLPILAGWKGTKRIIQPKYRTYKPRMQYIVGQVKKVPGDLQPPPLACYNSHAALRELHIWRRSKIHKKEGSSGISVAMGQMWGCWAGGARPTPPHFHSTTANPKKPEGE